jgi:hypothetical protein
MRQAVTSWIQTLDTEFFYARMHSMVPEGYKWSNAIGDCVEVWCVPSATRAPCIKQGQNIKFSKSTVFVMLSLEIPL